MLAELQFWLQNQEEKVLSDWWQFGESEVQRDLGVIVELSLKPGMHVQKAVRNSNGMLALIARGFNYRRRDFLLFMQGLLLGHTLSVVFNFALRKDILAS